MICPKCGALAPEGAKFCELDGTRLAPPEASTNSAAAVANSGGCRCGAAQTAIDPQGYCQECGRFCGNPARDHIEIAVNAAFGGVTDRGKRHKQNEDDMALALEDLDGKTTHILVVCDGVSSSEHAELASEAASRAALNALAQATRDGLANPEAAMRDAIRAANEAVCALPHTADSPKDPPETTLVAALVQNGVATLGWIGDSRAYWFADDIARQLTRDHSWINDVVDAGEMSLAEASIAPGSHAITRCLGIPDADNEDGGATEPGIGAFTLPGAGRLLLCSDGLWNYADTPERIADLLQQQPAEADAVTTSRALVEYANAQGGRDNITVIIANFS